MSKERMEKALDQLKTISEEDCAKVKAIAGIVKPLRSVLHKNAWRSWDDWVARHLFPIG
jgi:hypothetical protein